jgi:hypothetical protein
MQKKEKRNQNDLLNEDTNLNVESDNRTHQGQFYVYQKHSDNTKTKVLVNPLSQDELARGWSLVLPRVRNDTRIHHFKIFLSHLPEHLWNKLHTDNDNLHYNVISDNIYRYSVQKTDNDNYIKELYRHVMKRNFNSIIVKELYDNLKNENVKGWLMIRARYLLSRKM